MLRLNGITKIFGGLTALEDVSFSVADGSITGVIGPNGAGKTTLFNIITGLYTQTSGDVYLGGKNISLFRAGGACRTWSGAHIPKCGTIRANDRSGKCHGRTPHQEQERYFFQCAFKLPGQIKEEKYIKEKSLQWLEFTGMADLADITAGNLPFGKGRLLEISRALAVEPRIILMDEPAAGLNSRETAELAVSSAESENPE